MNAIVTTALTLVPELLETLVTDLNNNGVLSISPNLQGILSGAAALVRAGDAALPELQALTDQVKAMVSADRDPTDAEWAELTARSNAANAIIQGTDTGS